MACFDFVILAVACFGIGYRDAAHIANLCLVGWRKRELKLLSMLSRIPTAYACCAIVVLIAGGFALNAFKAKIPMLSGSAGQITFGVCQIVLGLIILTLTYSVFRRVWS